MNIGVTRLANGLIIGPDLHPSIGVNIQGPSLICLPDRIDDRLGAYYLYFADHKGRYIRAPPRRAEARRRALGVLDPRSVTRPNAYCSAGSRSTVTGVAGAKNRPSR
jgi:hypothetical protein